MTADLHAPVFERTLQLLRELTAISSPSGDLAGLRRMTERLSAELSARGLTPEVREESGEPVLVAGAPKVWKERLVSQLEQKNAA